MDSKKIPAPLYWRIQSVLPIACVDVLVRAKAGGAWLGVRKNPPVKGGAWTIGGRLSYGERLEDAAIRKAKDEAGLKIRLIRQIGVYPQIFHETDGESRHCITVVYLANEVSRKPEVPKGSDLSGLIRIRRIEKGLHPYVRQILSDSNVFGKRISSHRKFFVN